TYAQNLILGHALLESQLYLGGKCIVSCVSESAMEFYGVKAKDLEGIVSQLRNTEGAEVAVFMYEMEKDVYKVSLRASDYADVSAVAQRFGGGGHVKAAGVTMSGSAKDIQEQLLEQIELQLGR
ncbi:MAG: bifunctional oligoribonuclease/PAP phosphatase NrnA, partial [Dorea sp.]